ncbi:hypothetical protein N8976_00575 [Gammaproteobacteria bacterium]|nr:hypothetical protein [Gammaproteobacteria bacterium]
MIKNSHLYLVVLTLILASCGGGGGGESSDSVTIPSTVSMSLSSNLNEIYIHNKIILSWSSSNADSCSASGDWSGTKINNGSEEIIIREPKDSAFTLTCSSNSSSAERNTTVTSLSPYLYPDHWDEINTYRESLQSVYQNPVGLNQEEAWFKTLTVPKSRFTTDVTNTFLDDENFRGDVGFDTWINIGDSTFHLNCNWVPSKPNKGAIKIIELINGDFVNLYYKQIEGCNHPLPLKNSDGSFQIVFPGHDEGKLSAGLAPFATSFVFNVDTKEFIDMDITLASHGQDIFDYDLDGDDDIITTGAEWFVNDPNAFPPTKKCGSIGIMQNNGLNDFNLITVPLPNDVSNLDPTIGFIQNQGCGGAMSADAYVENGILFAVYSDFNPNPNHTNPSWIIEPEKNVVIKYDVNNLTILEVIELPTPYVEANFLNLEYYGEDWAGANGKSHDTNSQFIDIDYDGDKDIVISNQSYWYEKTSVLQIIINNDGAYKDETADRLFNWNIRTGNLHQWNFSDVNGDGYLDITTTDGCGGDQNDLGIPRNFGCEKKVAINDGTGHFLQIIGPMEIYQIFESNEYKTGQLGSIFGLDSNKNLRWTYMTAKGCNDGCYANGDWDVFITSLDSPLSTGPNGIDPSLVGEDGYNEFFYLLNNPSAKTAVESGEYENGLEHYIAIGKDQGLLPNAKSLSKIVVESYDSNPKQTIN